MYNVFGKMINMSQLLRKGLNTTNLCKRNLFSENFLGVTAYRQKRHDAISSDKGRNLKIKLQKNVENPGQEVLSHQIKQMCYLAETPEDSAVFRKAFEKYCRSTYSKGVVFQNFRIGPEIMRMYYVLNLPLEGMSLLQNPITSNFFNDIKSFAIIQDLLYNNEMYIEVCEIFNIIKEKQISGWTMPFINYMVFQAALYKMNTLQSYNEIMKNFKEFMNFCKRPAWPVIMYTMIFALENGAAELPLKHPLGHDDISANITLTALIKTGNVSEAVKYFNELHDKSKILHSVALDLYSNVEEFQKNIPPNTDILDLKEKLNNNYFTNRTFGELAAEKIYSLQKLEFS